MTVVPSETQEGGTEWPEKLFCKDGQVVQYTTIKVRLYPTETQAELFEKTFGCCRCIWNQMLADEQRFYYETGKHFILTPAKYKTARLS